MSNKTQKQLLNSISAAQFALTELGLYLDTHPTDKKALEKFEAYRSKYLTLVKQYESQFGPITLIGDFGNDGFDWVENPWPWEKEAN